MKRFSFITKLMCVFFVPFALFGGPLTLLCVGEDGHFAIETGRGSSCESVSPCSDSHDHAHDHESAQHSHSEPKCESEQECCGSCVDFELELDDATVTLGGQGDPITLLLLARPCTPFSLQFPPFPCLGIPGNKGPPHALSGPLESFRTVRLLI